LEFLNSKPYYASKKIVNQSSDFPVRRTGSYRHKKTLACSMLSCCRKASERFKPLPGQSGMGLVEIWKDSQQDTARRRVWNRLPLSVLGDFQLEANKSCCHFLYKYKSLT